jgi:hypothetical protein
LIASSTLRRAIDIRAEALRRIDDRDLQALQAIGQRDEFGCGRIQPGVPALPFFKPFALLACPPPMDAMRPTPANARTLPS